MKILYKLSNAAIIKFAKQAINLIASAHARAKRTRAHTLHMSLATLKQQRACIVERKCIICHSLTLTQPLACTVERSVNTQ